MRSKNKIKPTYTRSAWDAKRLRIPSRDFAPKELRISALQHCRSRLGGVYRAFQSARRQLSARSA
eukprot:4662341-Pleurochrysis_carterae.AAC.1